jgi:hypothetical protein
MRSHKRPYSSMLLRIYSLKHFPCRRGRWASGVRSHVPSETVGFVSKRRSGSGPSRRRPRSTCLLSWRQMKRTWCLMVAQDQPGAGANSIIYVYNHNFFHKLPRWRGPMQRRSTMTPAPTSPLPPCPTRPSPPTLPNQTLTRLGVRQLGLQWWSRK